MFDDQKRRRLDAVLWATALAFLPFAVPELSQAAPPARPGEAAWREECGSCHVAYPARLLPAASWRELLATLDRHFGVDASLDAAAAAEIGRFLQAGAGPASGTTTGPPPLRVTATPWFRREHHEVTDARWRSAAVRSPANCQACHAGAEHSRFGDEHREFEGGRE